MQLEQIDRLYREILGPFPEHVDLNVEVIEEESCDGFTRTLIAWDNDAEERVRGYILRPEVDGGDRPAMMVFHGHGPWELGKKDTAGVVDR
ncbi:MAG: hypothetical protein VX910_01930, partial [Candidatus Latescibacterota bacterium]|nr:hypothetical protein [Candidatus Latescibacterota bacterium]